MKVQVHVHHANMSHLGDSDASMFDSTSPPSSLKSPSCLPGITTASGQNSDWEYECQYVYERNGLPSVLDSLGETDRLRVAFICEACETLRAEAALAEHRYQQMILVVKAYHLRSVEARDRFQSALKQRQRIIKVAVSDVSAARRGSRGGPDHRRLSSPSLLNR